VYLAAPRDPRFAWVPRQAPPPDNGVHEQPRLDPGDRRTIYQENDAETRLVSPRFVSSGNCVSSAAKKRWSWAA